MKWSSTLRFMQLFYAVMFSSILAVSLIPKSIASDNHSDLISLTFQHTPLEQVLLVLAEEKKLNLMIVDELDGRVSLHLESIEWQKALTLICQTYQLQCQIQDQLLTVNKIPENAIDERYRKAQQSRYRQQSLPVHHLTPQSVQHIINNTESLSQNGSVIYLVDRGVILMSDHQDRVNAIKQLIHQLDDYPQQIHIAANIVTMSDESIDELGIRWGYQNDLSRIGLNQVNVNLGVTNPAMSLGLNVARRKGNLLQLELSALEAENQLEIIASPNLMTSHLKMASIKQGTEIPYEVSSGNNGGTTIEFKQAVLGLEVTPRLLNNNMVELQLLITQNTTGQTIKRSDGGESLAIDTQEIQTQVIVEQGETVILGGIFQQQKSIHQSAVPGLSKVPVVGGLFRYKNKKLLKRELVIFITPNLIEKRE